MSNNPATPPSASSEHINLSVALDGAGWHPAAWREPGARPADLFTTAYWAELVTEAERGLLDFVTIEDSLGIQSDHFGGPPDHRTDQVRGRLDASLIAAALGPITSSIGLVPTVTTTHTEPFHISKSIATLDFASRGRAGWRVQVSGRAHEAAHFGRRDIPELDRNWATQEDSRQAIRELFDEAADSIEVVRRLWDSWEDDAEIRDEATGRFIDRDKLHYIDFEGSKFSVKGPSITPRPPQGQPVVTALAHADIPYELAARGADLVFVTPQGIDDVPALIGQVRAAEQAVGRTSTPLLINADLLVVLGDTEKDARDRLRRLDDTAGEKLRSDAAILATTPDQLATLLVDWADAGLDGFRLRPAVLPDDLVAITRGVVPALQSAGAFRHTYETTTLRDHLGLPVAVNRYAAIA
ncbi:LLM class flavin-dependent oxidoreductase [Blastococcus sp. Marseille-P5729]|uniref:LLM class flavin-dependent oxidoreductase n=1 Tax=Blastococcus sp. Marseille-P5729 TaxID=2086582 RepID=UPI000D0E4C5C|nr:LLM class flavin-dependent oxidoreductase [Blastococcus sp. Marseille-P5729]